MYFHFKKNLTPHPPLTHQSYGDIFMQSIVWKVGLLLMCIPIHTINCLKSWTINYMCTYSYNRLCEKLGYYSYGHVLVQLIVRRIRNMIVHMRVLFITCVLDCMNSCTSDCLYEHPWSDPSSHGHHPPLHYGKTIADKALYYSTIYPNSRDLGTAE